ncbi:MAG TPA: hypothetical protein VFX50_03660 [Gemmatimonadales bacterium]|nr:hypothetical protein [Gemmatimonadales bacterium]
MSLLRRLVPASLRRWRFVLSQLEPAERRALLAEAWRMTAGRASWRARVRSARRVSFVCHGNIIRSPFAAVAFASRARQRGLPLEVVSAGVAAMPGETADARAALSATERGESLASHRATPIDDEHVRGADVLFVMDRLNLARVVGRHPDAAGKVFLLAGCREDGGLSLAEIHDPVAGTLDDVRRSHDEVLAALARVLAAFDAP